NDVDADYIAARLIVEGHTPVSSPDRAESIIVNTCGFILEAKEESINAILNLSELKNTGMLKSLYAAGCLTQRNGDELLKGIPELDGAFGHGALDSIAKAVGSSARFDKTIKLETRKLGYLNFRNRFISDDWPYSYLKISDGCDRPCTYCAIPKMRGRYRSRPLDSIIKEAEFLAQNGKRELILVSQEATLWGYDLKGRPGTITLLKALEQVDGIDWIRLLYLYPGQVEDNLIEYMAEDNKTLNYYDLPLQHVNSDILSRMKRLVDRPRIDKLLSKIRRTSNDAVIRTTFIVGFPGETKKQFNELYDFVSENRLDRMGVFRYSPEDGTPAEKLSGQIPEKVKIERMDALMNLQRDIAFENNINLIGSVQKVLVDEINSEGFASGRTYADCPEIDQEVKIYGNSCRPGSFYNVLIDESEGYDLRGTVTGELL
ncbi:MAG: 30S ribosomal protein S12 methylthiotransferase RimO, partial [candidate division Zixibacteria bacterium]|nr:30S ribosomal protein S12 methylthiotransferase RimO [candidate division Zixibacteria bacterium]